MIRPQGCGVPVIGVPRSTGFNGLLPANIPYAKEIFWMSKYQQVTGRARTMRPA